MSEISIEHPDRKYKCCPIARRLFYSSLRGEGRITSRFSNEFSRTENRIQLVFPNLMSFFWTHYSRVIPNLMFKRKIPISRLDFSRKLKKARSTSQPQLCSENTPATIESDQILLPFSSWRATVTLPTSTKSVGFQNSPDSWRRQCPYSMRNQKNLKCLNSYSKRV